MEIIGGTLRHRKLISPPGHVRPIPVLLRKSMFDILRDRIDGCAFLDGFAGSGVVGMEALSRGAARVDFVESDARVAGVLRKNLVGLPSTGDAHVHHARYEDFLRKSHDSYDVVFLDPPYDSSAPSDVIEKTLASALLHQDSILIMKAPARWSWARSHTALFRERFQGDNGLYFFRR